jgi:single-strand DNA-binding protein
MAGINKVILIGNIGKDPEVRYLENGNCIASVSLATSQKWKDKNGEAQERTEWHRVVFYQRLAEVVSEYVHKGSKLYVEGMLRTRSYDKDGVTHYVTDVIANQIQLLDGKSESGHAQSSSGTKKAGNNKKPVASAPDFDDDIPF